MDAPGSSAAARVLTPANGLSLLRLLAAPALFSAVVADASLAAAALFGLAVVTDLADGRVARRRGEVSAFGGFLDHGSDAAFVTLGLLALACTGAVPLALPLLVALAFAQYTLDSRVLAGRALRASRLGRLNGIAYFVLLGIPLGRDALGLPGPAEPIVRALGWFLAGSTALSIADRARALARARRDLA